MDLIWLRVVGDDQSGKLTARFFFTGTQGKRVAQIMVMKKAESFADTK